LRARGVEAAAYDVPHLNTVDGVAAVGFALSAWFVDPTGNTVGQLQFKDMGLARAGRTPPRRALRRRPRGSTVRSRRP
jgi:hypothetical protein